MLSKDQAVAIHAFFYFFSTMKTHEMQSMAIQVFQNFSGGGSLNVCTFNAHAQPPMKNPG